MDEVPKEIKDKLGKYISNVGGRTFTITGLPPELTGGALARYSRAATGLQLTIINEFLDDNGEPSQAKGSALMDRVLNAFGDESVGELEGTHVGIEDISQLLTKLIEDHRIGGSPIEQSTRYVKYDNKDSQGKWRYIRPREIMESGLGTQFERENDFAFQVYSDSIKRLSTYFRQILPIDQFEIEVVREGKQVRAKYPDLISEEETKAFNNAYNFTIRCAALDVGRCTLPSTTLTHVGLYGNGRFFTGLLTSMKSSNFSEFRERGEELEAELNKVIPTFIKRNRTNNEWNRINSSMRDEATRLFGSTHVKSSSVTLIPHAEFIDQVIAESIFPHTQVPLSKILSHVETMSPEEKIKILEIYVGNRKDRRDRTDRGLEAGYPITFELVGTFAEYRDLQRHRMLTQQRQALTTENGFFIPPEILEVGLEDQVLEAAARMADLNSNLKHAGLNEQAQYATLFNHLTRFMIGMNLREAQHLLELRTQPAGHYGYRAMTQEMTRQIIARDPWTAIALQHVNYSDPGNKIARAREQGKIAGKGLKSGIDTGIDLNE